MNWEIGINFILGVTTILLTIWLFVVSNKSNETAVKAAKIEKLSDEIAGKAESLVETKFALLASEFKGVMAQLRTVVEGIEKRLERGDVAFNRQDELQRTLEIQAERRLASCAKNFASRTEVQKLMEEVHFLELKLAKFEERVWAGGGQGHLQNQEKQA